MNIFNRDMKNYKAQDEKAKTGELIAMAFVAFLFLVLLSWITERDNHIFNQVGIVNHE